MSTPNSDSDILKAPEAARFLGLGVSTIYRLCERNTLPRVRLGCALRFRRSTLENFLSSQEASALAAVK